MWLWFTLIAAAVGWWRLDVWFHPFAPCRRCQGTGRNKGSRIIGWIAALAMACRSARERS